MMRFVRCVLWVALIATSAFFCLLLYVLPSFGDVAQLMELVVGVALVTAWIALWSWGETAEAVADERERWARKDRFEELEVEEILNAHIAKVVPGGVLVLEDRLKRLAATRAVQA